jgi:hypothetical protein
MPWLLISMPDPELELDARRDELEKHQKKGGNLGVDEPDTRRRIRLLDGDTTPWGLIRLFAPESAESEDGDDEGAGDDDELALAE